MTQSNDKIDLDSINFQCIDAIKVSLWIEKEGLGFYEKAAKHIKNPKVKSTFLRLAEEEKQHIQTLQEKARHLQPVLSRKSSGKNQVDVFISKNLKGKVFPSLKETSGDFSEMKDDLEALDFGISSEQRSIDLLSGLLQGEKKIDVRAIFLHLVVEEKKHLQALQELKNSLMQSAKVPDNEN